MPLRICISKEDTISNMYIDNKFEPLNNKLEGRSSNLNTIVQEEHVPEIERQIRVVNERACSTWNTLSFACMPHVMLVELLLQVVMCLNTIPLSSGVSTTQRDGV